ncbi:hypothetical protein KKH3_24780 [Pectobacterium actinidiae]|nr:hypothetical protein KKH3_24780 [Pectobacterium actinidiae]
MTDITREYHWKGPYPTPFTSFFISRYFLYAVKYKFKQYLFKYIENYYYLFFWFYCYILNAIFIFIK